MQFKVLEIAIESRLKSYLKSIENHRQHLENRNALFALVITALMVLICVIIKQSHCCYLVYLIPFIIDKYKDFVLP